MEDSMEKQPHSVEENSETAPVAEVEIPAVKQGQVEDPAAVITALQNELNDIRAKADEYVDGWQRARAVVR